MNDFLHLEVTDYFFQDKRDMRKSVEPLMNIYFKYTDEKLNVYEISVISNDIFRMDNKDFLLTTIIVKLNNYKSFEQERQILILKKESETLDLYYSLYLNIESELLKIINNHYVIKKMHKYYLELLYMMNNNFINNDRTDFYEGLIINNKKKYSCLFINENEITSIIVKKSIYDIQDKIDFKDTIYQLDLKNRVFIKKNKHENRIIHLENNSLLNKLIQSKLKEQIQTKDDKEMFFVMNLLINEVLYFSEEYKEEDKLNQYTYLLNDIINKI